MFIILLKIYYFSHLTNTVFITLTPLEYLNQFAGWLLNLNEGGQIFEGLILISFGTILLSTFWIIFLKGKLRLIAILVLNIIFSFIILADAVYFRYFGDLISMTVLSQLGQVGDVGESITALFRWSDLLFIIDILLIIPIFFIGYKKDSKSKNKFIPRAVIGLAVLFIGFQLTFIPFNKSMENGGAFQFNKLISNMRVYNFTGLLGFHGADIYRYVNDNYLNKTTYSAEEVKDIDQWLTNENNLLSSEYEGIAEGKNIIILQVEALQNFVINQEINGQVITPNLNKLTQEEVYFDNFYEQTALGRTSDAEFLLNNSLYPTASGSAYMLYAKNEYESLPEKLKQEQYNSTVYHAYNPSFWNRYIIYNQFEIDEFYSKEDFSEGEAIGWSLNDKDMLLESLEDIKSRAQPSYSHLITLTSHHPFEMPEKYETMNLEGYTDYSMRYFRNYINSIHYVDEAVGQFVDALKEEGMWDNTLLLIYGDHSSGLTKDDPAFNAFANTGEEYNYFIEDKRIPLIMHLPGNDQSETINKVGSQIDLAPTIAHLAGIEPSSYWLGSNLLSDAKRQATFRDGSFISDQHAFLAAPDGIYDNGSCFDRQTESEVPVEECREEFNTGIQELRISDKILDGNLIQRIKAMNN